MKKFVVLIFSLCGWAVVHAQNPVDIQELLASRKFSFVPQSVMPVSGGSRQVISDYRVKLSGDSLEAYLPYFGRANAPILPDEAGIDFISTSFEYKWKKGKKKTWELSIRPKDGEGVRQMNFTLYSNANARLFVNSTNKQPITYFGYVVKD